MIVHSVVSDKKILNRSRLAFWTALLLLMILKYTYLGLEYFPVLDDHNTYGFLYNTYTPQEAFIRLATSRPIAYFFDCFIISRLWQNMWIVLIGTTTLHWLCCILIFKIFEKLNLGIGYLSIIIFALAPFSTEATYWIAASSRLVIGLFFCLASIYLLVHCVTNEKTFSSKKLAILYVLFWLVNLLSMGFYEQITIFAFAIPVVIFVLCFKELKHKWGIILPFLNLSIFGFYYIYFRDVGQIASRGKLVSGDLLSHTENVMKTIRKLVLQEQWLMIKNGVIRGLELAVSNVFGFIVSLAAIVLLSVYCCKNLRSLNDNQKSVVAKLLLSIFLFILPFGPFFILDNTYMANRNVFLSLFAMGLLIETLVCLFFKWDKRKIGPSMITGALCIAFLLTNFSEINDYRNISRIDQQIITNLAQAYTPTDDIGDGTLLFNAKDIYTDVTQRHFSNCTAVDWSLTGAVQSLACDVQLGILRPVKAGAMHLSITPESRYLYYGISDNLEIFTLNGVWRDDELVLMKDDGSIFGVVASDDKGKQTFEIWEKHSCSLSP